MVMRSLSLFAAAALLAGCGDSDSAEERYLDHYQDSVEQAREVSERLERVQERRRQQMEEHEPR